MSAKGDLLNSARVQDLHASDAEVTLKTLGAWATALMALGVFCVRIYKGAVVVRRYASDFAALPHRVRETHEQVTAHGRVLDLHLASSSVLSFHCNSTGVVRRASLEFARLGLLGEGVAFRDLFLHGEREALDAQWERCVRDHREFSFIGHIQGRNESQPLRVSVRVVPLSPNAKSERGVEWFGIMRLES